jgi:hypothetical protein
MCGFTTSQVPSLNMLGNNNICEVKVEHLSGNKTLQIIEQQTKFETTNYSFVMEKSAETEWKHMYRCHPTVGQIVLEIYKIILIESGANFEWLDNCTSRRTPSLV